ncbi:MAG: class I tRNA ligase family protein [Acidimicrobiales bacterium]
MTLTSAIRPGDSLKIDGAQLPVIGTARVYVCGITPYDTTHLGHASTFIWTDLAAKVLRLCGSRVDVCRNVTDVDDHLIAAARSRQVPWQSLATQETYRFERDMTDLRIGRPSFEPRSHDHVDDVISLAAVLIERGLAYERNGSVYFKGTGVPEQVGVSRSDALALNEAASGKNEEADDPLDIAIWQRSAENDPRWPSPWGQGRPGWHAECTAMALTTFGPSVDLHGGGADLRFPHHAYEAALSEALTGVRPFSRSWMHVGSVHFEGAKMAKSTGNLVFVHDLVDRWPAGAIRLLVLSRRWQDDWEFNDTALSTASADLDDLWRGHKDQVDHDAARRSVVEALLDDLDVPRALSIAAEAGGKVLSDLGEVLGLFDGTTAWEPLASS